MQNGYNDHKYRKLLHSEKSLIRSMLFYSRKCRQQNWAQFVLYINSDCMYISYLWLQLWLNNHCKNTGYYFIFQLSFLLLLNNYQYNCNNTISSVTVHSINNANRKFESWRIYVRISIPYDIGHLIYQNCTLLFYLFIDIFVCGVAKTIEGWQHILLASHPVTTSGTASKCPFPKCQGEAPKYKEAPYPPPHFWV